MDAYVARQPIFNKQKKIYGYELLFRDSMANFMPDIDGDTASSKLLSSSFYTIGIDTMTSGKRAFINFTQNLLVQKLPLMFPRENTVVEILENVTPDTALIEALTEFVKNGYVIALDDFVYSAQTGPLISMAHIIKYDFMQTPLDEIELSIKKLPANLRLLAEKVENYEVFKAGMDMGFELFQGYFFCKPEVIKGREISSSSINLLQIMSITNKADFEFEEVEKLMARDVSLSYKLLRYINSAYFGRKKSITSIKEALVYMGEGEVKRFIALVAMSKLASGKTDELVKTSCLRAKFCELCSDSSGLQTNSLELFTLGIFSLIDAILDQPMQKIMENLPLSDNIREALVHRQGRLTDFIVLVECYEQGDWEGLKEYSIGLKINEAHLPAIYLQACKWADTLTQSA